MSLNLPEPCMLGQKARDAACCAENMFDEDFSRASSICVNELFSIMSQVTMIIARQPASREFVMFFSNFQRVSL